MFEVRFIVFVAISFPPALTVFRVLQDEEDIYSLPDVADSCDEAVLAVSDIEDGAAPELIGAA